MSQLRQEGGGRILRGENGISICLRSALCDCVCERCRAENPSALRWKIRAMAMARQDEANAESDPNIERRTLNAQHPMP